jgi:hypothetical protein
LPPKGADRQYILLLLKTAASTIDMVYLLAILDASGIECDIIDLLPVVAMGRAHANMH